MDITHRDTILLVEDITRSLDFYQNILGLEILHNWETMIVFKERFSIHQADRLLPSEVTPGFIPQDRAMGAGNVVVYFELPSEEALEQLLEELSRKNVPIIHNIVDLPWQKIFRASDPDGHILEFGTPDQE